MNANLIMKCTKTKTCNNCMHLKYITGYDKRKGAYGVMHSWCDKDKSLMDSHDFKRGEYGHGNLSHYVDECEYFEEVKNG